jgi:ribosome-binding protein aMBF1 (putative translation factor)
VSPSECRAAREALGWSEARLAQAAGLAERTVRLFEAQACAPRQGTIIALRKAIRSAAAKA